MSTQSERPDATAPGKDIDPEVDENAGKHSRWKPALVVGLLVAMVAGYLIWSHYSTIYPSTRDAYVNADVVRIAPQVSGTVETVGPSSFTAVKQGDLLLRIDQRPFNAALNSAKANLAQARQRVRSLQAQVDEAEATLRSRQAELSDVTKESARIEVLVADGSVSRARADAQAADLSKAQEAVREAQGALSSAKAELGVPGDQNPEILAAMSALASAEIDLDYTEIFAPANGTVGEIGLRPGSYVAAGTQSLELVETGHWWVDANFKETALERIHPGQRASVTVDMYPDLEIEGRVAELSPASGVSFSLFPPENATGNWVKVTRRFPVRVMIDGSGDMRQLRLGASAHVTVDTSGYDRSEAMAMDDSGSS